MPFLSDNIPKSKIPGYFQTLFGFVQMIGGPLFGYMIQKFGIRWALHLCYFSTVLSGISLYYSYVSRYYHIIIMSSASFYTAFFLFYFSSLISEFHFSNVIETALFVYARPAVTSNDAIRVDPTWKGTNRSVRTNGAHFW